MNGWLVQILLPLLDGSGARLPSAQFDAVREELVARFGGLTAYTRAPAKGLWAEGGEQVVRDDIVVYEVMAETLDRAWWRDWRAELERRFRQDEIVIRAHEIARL